MNHVNNRGKQRISYIFIYYRGRLEKVVGIFHDTGTYLHKKFSFKEQICLLGLLPLGLNNKNP